MVSKTTPDAVAEVWRRALWHCAQYCVMTPAYRAASSADDRTSAVRGAGRAGACACGSAVIASAATATPKKYAERVIETQSLRSRLAPC